MSESENGKDRAKLCEQNCREAVVAFCEHKTSQAAAASMKSGEGSYTGALRLDLPAAFSAYCTMRSTDRQEILMKDMHQGAIRMERQSNEMIRLTWWIMAMTVAVVVLTGAVVILTIVQPCRS